MGTRLTTITLALFLLLAGAYATAQPVPNMPSDGATGQSINTMLGWRPLVDIPFYEVEIALDPSFDGAVSLVSETAGVEAANLLYETTYHWRVRGVDAAFDSLTPWSAAQSFTTIPSRGIPQPLSPEDGATGQPLTVVLLWSEVEGAAGYEVEWDRSAGFQGGVRVAVGDVNGYTVEGLGYEEQIFWRVRTMSAAGGPGSEWSRYATFTTDYAPIPTLSPPRLQAPANDATGLPTSVALLWSDVGSEGVLYDVEVSTTAAFDTIVMAFDGLDTTTAEATPLDEGTTYYWRARAANVETTSDWSTAWRFTTARDATPGLLAPQLLSPGNGAQELPTDLIFTWDSIPGAAYYEVEFARDPSFADRDTMAVALDSATASLGGFLPGTLYYWRARAGAGEVTSGWSQPFRFLTASDQPLLPSRPVLLAPDDGAADLAGPVALRWEQADYAAHYFIHLSTTGAFTGEEMIYDAVDTLLTVDSLATGTRYYWRAQGTNQHGESPWSETRSFTMRGISGVADDAALAGALRIYPVPATDMVTIAVDGDGAAGDIAVALIDGRGRIVAEGEATNGSRTIALDIAALPSGVYRCRITAGEAVVVRPLVVVR